MNIPVSFLHPLFNPYISKNDFKSFQWNDCLTSPFKYDIAYALGIAPTRLPWENKNEFVPMLFTGWKNIEYDLIALHETRDQAKAKAHMIQAIAWFIQAVFWMNKEPVRDLSDCVKEMNVLQYKPVNMEERLDFVMKKPGLYHAFIQLQQLFSECSKLFYKIKAIEKQ